MSTFREATVIDAPRAVVWNALSDIGSIADWNPGLIGSRRINDVDGVGGTRHCDVSAKRWLTEEVVDYEPLERITFRITDSTMPFAEARIRFRLVDRLGSTDVEVSPDYRLKYGLLGRPLDLLIVRRTYRRGMRHLLAGLKGHLERGACRA